MRPGRPTPTRINTGNMAAAGLAAVLFILPALAIWAAFATYQAGSAARHASDISDAYQRARYSIGAEESLERKYRIEPSLAVRRQHQEAAASVVKSMERVRTLNGQADGAPIDALLAKHAAYLVAIERMFAAIDAGNAALTNTIDETEADPAFDAIETVVDAAAFAHRHAAAQYLHELASIQRKVLIAAPIVLALGMGSVALFWFILRGYRQQAIQSALREAASHRAGERRFSALVQNASDLILICGAGGDIMYYTPSAATNWDYSGDALRTRPLAGLVHLDDQPAFYELWQQALAWPALDRRCEMRLQDGAEGWRHTELILTNLLQDAAVQGVVGTVRDITARKVFEQQLKQQAFYDSLTGLPNRALFQDRLAQAMGGASHRQRQVGLLFIDLDNFKLVNDSLGHLVGDVLLIEAARRLQACVQSEQTVARIGGDEFVILIPQVSGEADASWMAERIAQEFARPFTLDTRDVVVTASVGIALGDAGHETAESLLRNADVAMYRAKSGGKGAHVVFEASMHTDALVRLELESDLRQAFERSEFYVHYQPIVTLQSGRIHGAEALVRWKHPKRGLIAPSEFIPVAEEMGLIVPLGQWVLEQACRQAALWRAEYPIDGAVTMGVNLSPRQFQQPNLVENVERALHKAGLAPESLKLEITEGVAMRDAEATIVTLGRLKQLGLQLAIDDFGTGYSSLAYLKRLPLDILKIDRSFVTGAGENEEDTAIVRAIISLAQSLNLTVTAEGIETDSQAILMRSWGCERGQGYYWSRPVEAELFGRMLAAEEHPAAPRAVV